jgi:hypothetical protein
MNEDMSRYKTIQKLIPLVVHDVILTQPQYNGTAETTEPRL